jgi:hypothetical protein
MPLLHLLVLPLLLLWRVRHWGDIASYFLAGGDGRFLDRNLLSTRFLVVRHVDVSNEMGYGIG